jgi:hypothetical protein
MRSEPRADNANLVAAGPPDLRLIVGASMLVPLAWLAMLAPAASRLPF